MDVSKMDVVLVGIFHQVTIEAWGMGSRGLGLCGPSRACAAGSWGCRGAAEVWAQREGWSRQGEGACEGCRDHCQAYAIELLPPCPSLSCRRPQVAELLASVPAPVVYWEQGHEWLFGDAVRFQVRASAIKMCRGLRQHAPPLTPSIGTTSAHSNPFPTPPPTPASLSAPAISNAHTCAPKIYVNVGGPQLPEARPALPHGHAPALRAGGCEHSGAGGRRDQQRLHGWRKRSVAGLHSWSKCPCVGWRNSANGLGALTVRKPSATAPSPPASHAHASLSAAAWGLLSSRESGHAHCLCQPLHSPATDPVLRPPPLQDILSQEFGRSSCLVPNGIDCNRFQPGPHSGGMPTRLVLTAGVRHGWGGAEGFAACCRGADAVAAALSRLRRLLQPRHVTCRSWVSCMQAVNRLPMPHTSAGGASPPSP